MVFIRLFRILIFTETFSPQIVIMIDASAPPVGVAFDAEMVVRLARQFALPGAGFQQALRKRDTRRYAVFFLMLDGQVAILFDVLFV